MNNPHKGKSFEELTTMIVLAFDAMLPPQRSGIIMLMVQVHTGAGHEETLEFLEA